MAVLHLKIHISLFWLSHCSTVPQNFTILEHQLWSQALTGHQISDTAELRFKITAHLCDGGLHRRKFNKKRVQQEIPGSLKIQYSCAEPICILHPWLAQFPLRSPRSQLSAYCMYLFSALDIERPYQTTITWTSEVNTLGDFPTYSCIDVTFTLI